MTKIFFLVSLLEDAFYKIELQKSRINSEMSKKRVELKTLFADIHFFLISASNLLKVLREVGEIKKQDIDYQNIYKKYIKDLEFLNIFRGHLEHFTDGRLDGKGKGGIQLKNPMMLGNLIGEDYNFGGEKFNLPDIFKLLGDLQEELKLLSLL